MQEQFDTNTLLRSAEPLPNDDLALKSFIAERGRLYRHTSVIGVRPAIPGELVETWIQTLDEDRVLERTTTAQDGDLVAIGALGERYVPSSAIIEATRVRVGTEGLRADENAPPIPADGHVYVLYRTNGHDYRLATPNPFVDQFIYLRTSSGRVQTGVPGGLMAAQISPLSGKDAALDVISRLDVVRFIGPKEFAASYMPADPDDYARFGIPAPMPLRA